MHTRLSFNPDVFSIEVAEEQQIMTNRAAAAQAQGSASAAQTSANQAGAVAEAAGEVGVIDSADIKAVNKRVSDLGDYKTVAEAGIYFPIDGSTLDDAAKADLDTLAGAVSTVNGYLIEIAGYASSTGTPKQNHKLSEERAAAVANYLRSKGNIPMRRIIAPAGY
jgi:outer membrane protein OmpA-like peptidoglycan-associated protein